MLTDRIPVIRLMLKNVSKYMSMLQLQFWTDVKIQRKVEFTEMRVYHTQKNNLRKQFTQLTLRQQASWYV